MRDNFKDLDDSNLINNKFWSYIKATSSSLRIPELVYLDNVFRTDPKDELFNSHFYNQFSEASSYDTPIDTPSNSGGSIDSSSDIDFSQNRVRGILRNLNANKTMGPDRINGRILKNCSGTLASPLSILFDKCYYSGEIPAEWKTVQ